MAKTLVAMAAGYLLPTPEMMTKELSTTGLGMATLSGRLMLVGCTTSQGMVLVCVSRKGR